MDSVVTSEKFVLLIEDNPDHAEMVRRAFSRARDELKLVCVDSMEEACAVLDSSSPALVLCDYLLSDGSGMEILKRYAGRRGASSPFILLTSHGDQSVAVEAMKSGATDYIIKSEASLLSLPDLCRATIREYHEKRERARVEERLQHSQKMESIGRLAGGVAHDFNNMLSVILGYAELSKLGLPEEDPLWHNLNEVTKAANRSREITRQLLAFSRKEVISPKAVCLNDLIRETENSLIRLIGEDIHLSFFLGAELWQVRIDPTQVDQVLVNLAVNARDAMPRGGSLTIRTRNLSTDSPLALLHFEAPAGDYVCITVTDDGHGMDRTTLEHIFEPFFTTKGLGQGTGLGLATVYGIVTQNDGFVGARSNPGQGTEFIVLLPRLVGEHASADQPAPGVAPGTGVVLLVEDDEAVRGMTAQMLEFAGYRVLAARSPREALGICGSGTAPIDVILTDVIMPGMSGKEMADCILELRPGIKFVFMSGYTSDIIAQRGVLEEGTHFIRKPFDLKSLTQKIAAALAER